MKSILIIGHGKWANKILFFLKKKQLFNKIYIKTRNEIFILRNKNKKRIKILPHYNNIDLIHICTPLSTHFKYVIKFFNHKSLIIEKPFLRNLDEFSNIKKNIYKKKSKVIVNYIDLYNPILNILKKRLKSKFTKIVLDYSDPNSFFKKKYLSIEDWLEHPLSVILFFFKKFSKFKVLKTEFVKIKGNYLEKIEVEYLYKKIKIIIRINFTNKKNRKIYFYSINQKDFYADLRKMLIVSKNKTITYKSNDNALLNLYNSVIYKKIIKAYTSMNFYKKILKQRISIINSIKNGNI
jgi:hypothetical protein